MRTVVFSKVEQAFHAAMAARESGTPVDLSAICNGDPALQAEVEILLKHVDQLGESDAKGTGPGGGFLNPAELHAERKSVEKGMLEEWGASAVGQRVGDFTLIEQIGKGAMGVVFLAEQSHPQRTVALKIIRRNVATPAMIRRFEREAQLLGSLNHAGIAQVYAAGVADLIDDNGAVVRAPFIALEYVDGPNILQFVCDHREDDRVAMKMMSQICDAIQHAHQRGIIHRDLKPANILVASDESGHPEAKVLDFGVARQADRDDPDSPGETKLTLVGHFIGTPAYMSPEQMRSSSELDTRSDVYALGAILYQLLAGHLPIATADCSLAEAARRIATDQPTRLGTINRAWRGDVETIVEKALHKDPAQRYQSAAELKRDIDHYLAGEMIEARRDSRMYILAKEAARYRNLFVAAAILLIAGLVFALYARRQQHITAAAKADADIARNLSDQSAARLAAELSAVRIEQGRLLGEANDLAWAEKLLWDEWFDHPGSLAANWALRELYWRSHCVQSFAPHGNDCRTIAVAPDATRFATGGGESLIRLWSLPGVQQTASLPSGIKSVRSICFMPSGDELAVAGDGGACILDPKTASRRQLGQADSYTIACASTGRAIATGSEDGAVRLFDPGSGELTLSIPAQFKPPSPVRAVSFDPSCTHLAAIYFNGEVRLWQLQLATGSASATPGPAIEAHPGATGASIAFSPDGTMLATGSTDRAVKLSRVSDGKFLTRFISNNGTARSIAFSPDGARIVVPGYWRTQIFEVQSGAMTALGDAGGFDARFAGENQLIVAGAEGACRVWDFSSSPAQILRSTPWLVRDLAVAQNNGQCLLASIQGEGELRLRVLPPGSGRQVDWQTSLAINVGDRSRTLAMSNDGAWVVVGRADGHVLTVRANDGAVVQDWPAHKGMVNIVRITPDGALLVSGAADGTLRISRRRDAGGWEPAATLSAGGEVLGTVISPDASILVTTSRTASVKFWSLPTGKLLREIPLPKTPWKLAFSPDGNWLAVGAWDRSIQMWNTRSLATNIDAVRAEMSLLGHTQLVTGEAFDPTGRLLASVSNDGALRLWDVSGIEPATGDIPAQNRRRCLITLDAHVGDAYTVAFIPGTPDPRDVSVAVGYIDGTVRIWRLADFDQYIQGHVQYQKQTRKSLPGSHSAD